MVDGLHVVIMRAGSVQLLDGISTYIWNLASALSRYGIRVTVVAGYDRIYDDINHYVRKYFGVDFQGDYYVLTKSKPKSIRELFLFELSIKAESLLKELKPDIIHANTMVPVLYKAPKVLTFHGLMNFDVRMKSFNFIMNIFWDKIIHRSFKKIIVVSGKARREFYEYISKRTDVLVIPPMIDINILNSMKVKRSSNKRDLAILHRGTHSRKNVITTLLVFRALKNEFPNLKLWIIGDPRDVMRLAKTLNINSKDIEVFNNIPWVKLQELYASAYVTLCPSFYEAFGYVVLESLAHGTPVIASSAIAEELVQHGFNGFVINSPSDVHTFTRYLRKLLIQKDLWDVMSLNALKTAEMFSVERVLPKIVTKVYASALKP